MTELILATCAFLLFGSTIALGQDVPAEVNPDILGYLTSLPWLAKALAFVMALQIFLRGAAEALTRVADYTETKWDNKLAAWFSQASWFLGVFLGKLGYGVPKLVIEEKAKQVAEKPKEAK